MREMTHRWVDRDPAGLVVGVRMLVKHRGLTAVVRLRRRSRSRWARRGSRSSPRGSIARCRLPVALMSLTVAQRTREIGIPTTLGAQPWRVLVNARRYRSHAGVA
jgi:hypothetical protein